MRDIRLCFRVSSDELAQIERQMAEADIPSLSAYLRRMVLNGYCIHLDTKEFEAIIPLLRECSDKMDTFDTDDAKEIKNLLDVVWENQKQSMQKIAKIS